MTSKGTGVDPWLLWGNTETITMVGAGGVSAPLPVQTSQLVNVDYHHPTTWHFFFHAQITVEPTAPVLLNEVFVDFAVQLGVGRSNVRIDPFARAGFSPAQASSQALSFRFTDNVQAEAFDPFTSFDPTPPAGAGQSAQNIVRFLTAQSLQIQASLHSTGAQALNQVIQAQCTAYVAPVTHVRPEWYAGIFGNELRGK